MPKIRLKPAVIAAAAVCRMVLCGPAWGARLGFAVNFDGCRNRRDRCRCSCDEAATREAETKVPAKRPCSTPA